MKFMKMLVEYGVDNLDDLLESVKGKVNSFRWKVVNVEVVVVVVVVIYMLIVLFVVMFFYVDMVFSGSDYR